MTDPENSRDDVALLVSLLRLSSVLNRPMRDGVADPEGLSLNELRVMMSVGGEGEVAGSELAELIGMQPMNVSRALAKLSQMGWVEQTPDASNRRRKPHRLSRKGIAAHRAMTPEVATVASFLFADMSDAECAALSALLQKLDAQIAAWLPPAKSVHVPRA
jgi:DNA-binding MarR family transcriptional regulator